MKDYDTVYIILSRAGKNKTGTALTVYRTLEEARDAYWEEKENRFPPRYTEVTIPYERDFDLLFPEDYEEEENEEEEENKNG